MKGPVISGDQNGTNNSKSPSLVTMPVVREEVLHLLVWYMLGLNKDVVFFTPTSLLSIQVHIDSVEILAVDDPHASSWWEPVVRRFQIFKHGKSVKENLEI